MKRDVTQSAETQQKANPYSPFTSYNDYCNQIIFMAMDMNDITRGVPPLMIADLWLLNANLRRLFRSATYMAHFVHREDMLQRLLPWCWVNIAQYAKRYDNPACNPLNALR